MEVFVDLEFRPQLVDLLLDAIETGARLEAWLKLHYPQALARVGGQGLEHDLTNLISWSDGVDGMYGLLRKLADNPPRADIPAALFWMTHGKIKAEAKTSRGLPPVPAHKNWFAAGRPFVNRSNLRDQIENLEGSEGVESILVIDGDTRTGKSFAVSMILGCKEPGQRRPLDIDDFARFGRVLNAHDLAVMIAGDSQPYSGFDATKEAEAVPWLLDRLIDKLKEMTRWIIIDHCNRPALSDAARQLIVELAGKLHQGHLPYIRLILVDFDRSVLPGQWRDYIRHDHAELPDEACVEQWCLQLAAAAKRKHSEEQARQWAKDVFADLGCEKHDDGSWHIALERNLRQTHALIMACEEEA